MTGIFLYFWRVLKIVLNPRLSLIVSGVASIGAVPPLTAKKKWSKIGKKRGKIGKKSRKRGKIRKKGQNREGSFTLPLLTNRAGYATADSSFKIGGGDLLVCKSNDLRAVCNMVYYYQKNISRILISFLCEVGNFRMRELKNCAFNKMFTGNNASCKWFTLSLCKFSDELKQTPSRFQG